MSKAPSLFAALSLSTLLLASTAQATPRRPTHIACVGDSITEGVGASNPSQNYVSQLQMLLGDDVQVRNFGRSGATLLSGGDLPYVAQSQYADATSFVDGAGPDAVVSVVIILGANDSKPWNWDMAGRPEQYKADYLALVEHFLALQSNPVVYVAYPLATGNNPCCDIRGTIIHDEQVPLIDQVAMEKHVPVIDLNTGTTNHPEYFPDGVHPNDAGYLVMAQLVQAGLEREPQASIGTPVMGAALPAGLIPITATVSGGTVDITSVEFFDGMTSLGTVMAPPFTFNWQANAGMHDLTIKVVDATLADATSDPVHVTVTDAMAGTGGASGGAGGGSGMGSGAMGMAGSSVGGVGGASGAMGMAGSSGGDAGGVALPAAGTTGGAAPNAAPSQSSGCACAVPGERGGAAVGWLVALGAALAWRRRRQQQSGRGRSRRRIDIAARMVRGSSRRGTS